MIELITKAGTRIGRISDDRSHDDIIYVDGKPITLSDAYSDPVLLKKFNDEIKRTNAVKLED